MNVLSCFDGISCGRYSLEKAGIPITSYYASEVDKYAIKIAQKNYPDTIQVGDVRRINITGKIKFDLLIGGSPCQGFSVAGKGLNFEDPRSKLFFEYVRILKALQKINPDILFMLENVAGCGKLTSIFKCACCGQEVNKENVYSVLYSLYDNKGKYSTMQCTMQDGEIEYSKEEMVIISSRKEASIQSESIQKREKEIFRSEEDLLSNEQRNYKKESQGLSQDGYLQKDQFNIQTEWSDENENRTICSEAKNKNDDRSGVCKNNSHPEEYKKKEISSIKKGGYTFIDKEIIIDGEQMSNLRDQEESTNRSHNTNNKRRNKSNNQSSASLQKLQSDKGQSINVLCDKCHGVTKVKFTSTDLITVLLGVEPVKINSALVCAQNRIRLYWANFPIEQPEDRGIILKDILENEVDEKYYLSEIALARIERHKYSKPTIDASKSGALNTKNNSGQLSIDSGTTLIQKLDKKGNLKSNQEKASTFTAGNHSGGNHSDMDLICVRQVGRPIGDHKNREGGLPTEQIIEERLDQKTGTLSTVTKDNYIIQRSRGKNKGGIHEFKSPTLSANRWEQNNHFAIRRLTPIECERLQGLPDNYTQGVSDSQRYKALGNGWQCDTTTHIFKQIKKPVS